MKENAFTLKMTNLNKNMEQLKISQYNRKIKYKYEKNNKNVILLTFIHQFLIN